MKINRKSIITGKIHELDLDVTEAQMSSYLGGKLLQDAFPHLSDDEREFIKTGITKEEWDLYIKVDDEESSD